MSKVDRQRPFPLIALIAEATSNHNDGWTQAAARAQAKGVRLNDLKELEFNFTQEFVDSLSASSVATIADFLRRSAKS